MRHKILEEVNATCNIPYSWLDKKWDSITATVEGMYSLTEDNPTYIPVVLGMFRKVLASNTAYTSKVDDIFMKAVLGEIIDPVPPTETTLPNMITPEATVIWVDIFKKQKKRVYKYDNNIEKWAAAIVLLKRLCKKKNIVPFGETVKEKTFLAAPSKAMKNVLIKIGDCHKFLVKEKLCLKREPVLQYKNIKKGSGINIVNITGVFSLRKGKTAFEVLNTMASVLKFKATSKPKVYVVKTRSKKSRINITYAKKSSNEIQIKVTLILNDSELGKVEQMGKPATVLKSWVGKKFVSATARRLLYDLFSEQFNITSMEDIVKLVGGINVQYIVESGDEEHQIALTEFLLDKAMKWGIECPLNYSEFLHNDEYRLAKQEEFTIDMEPGHEVIGPILL